MSLQEPGYYIGEIQEGAKLGEPPKNKTDPVVEIPFRIVGWVENGVEHPYDNPFDRTVYLHTTEGAWPYTEAKLKRVGFNGDFSSMSFTSTRVELECKHDTYEGKTREKWDFAKSGTSSKPAPPDVAARLTAKFRAMNPAPAAKGPAKAPAPKPPVLPADVKPVPPAPTGPEYAAVVDRNTAWKYVRGAYSDDKQKAQEAFQRNEKTFKAEYGKDPTTADEWKVFAQCAEIPF